MDSGSNVNRPAWAKWLLRRFERRQARQAVALVTVNRSLGELLGSRLGRSGASWSSTTRRLAGSHRPSVRPAPPGGRAAARHADRALPRRVLAASRPGGAGRAAILVPGMEAGACGLPRATGSLEAALRELAAEPRFGGRLHVLKAVSPDVLPAWVASADVGVMAIQASTLNHRLSSPNKLFESIAHRAAGRGQRLPRDAPDRARRSGLARSARCATRPIPASIAAAIRSILDLGPAERAALRARCLRAAHDRWNWETESAKLVALYASLADELGEAASDAAAAVAAAG